MLIHGVEMPSLVEANYKGEGAVVKSRHALPPRDLVLGPGAKHKSLNHCHTVVLQETMSLRSEILSFNLMEPKTSGLLDDR